VECFTPGLVKDGGIRDMNAIMGCGFMVFAGGRTPADITEPRCFPNRRRIEESRDNWSKLVIRDASLG